MKSLNHKWRASTSFKRKLDRSRVGGLYIRHSKLERFRNNDNPHKRIPFRFGKGSYLRLPISTNVKFVGWCLLNLTLTRKE